MSVVYFVKPVGMAGPVKIGCTTLIRDRMLGLQTWSPFQLELVAEVAGSYDLERRLHALFLDSRERGEWFKWSPELQAVIEQISAGTFDYSLLPPPVCLPNNPRKKGVKTERETIVHDARLLDDVLAFCDRTGIPPATFGRAATRDPALVNGLRNGRNPRRPVVNRIRQFMANYHAPASAAAA